MFKSVVFSGLVTMVALTMMFSCVSPYNPVCGDVEYVVADNGCLKKVWGNRYLVDEDNNFVEYFYYDSLKRLVKSTYFYLGYDSTDFKLTRVDSVNRIERKFEYDDENNIYWSSTYVSTDSSTQLFQRGTSTIHNINQKEKSNYCLETY